MIIQYRISAMSRKNIIFVNMLQCPCYFASFFIFFSFRRFKILSFIEKLLHMMSFHDDKILVDFHGCALRKIIGSPVLKAQCKTKGAQHMLYMYMGKERKIP